MAILYDDYKKEWQQAARNNPKKFNVEDSSVDARTNLKNKTLNHNEALKKYQDAYSKSLKREFEQKGITSLIPIKKENNPILTKDSKAFRNDSIVLPNLKKVNREIETERQKANRALNELRYAKYQYNADKVNNEKTSFWDKTGGTVVRGVSDLFSGFTAGENKYIDDEGRRYNLPTYNQLKQEKVSKDYSTKHGKFIGDVAYNTSKILASSAMNIVAPGSGTTLYWSDMFLDNLEKTKNDGYDTASSIAYSAIGTGFEYLTGKFLGSATKKLTGGKSSTLEKGLSDALSKVISNKKIVNILSNAGSEGAEEFFQEYLDNLNKLIVLDKKQPLSAIKDVVLDGTILRDALYSAAVGAATGGLLNFNDDIDETRNVNDIFKEQLELSKENITDKNTIKKIDTALSYINNNNNKTDIDNIKSEINAYKMLKEQSNLNEQQAAELKGLREQLRSLEETNENTTNNISENTKIDNVLPTVEDIVNQEKANQKKVSLPIYNQQNSIDNFDNTILPTINDFNNSSANTSTNNTKIDTAKIKHEILQDIKGFKLGDPSIDGYKGSYIKTMLNEVGIKVPAAMNYVSEVRPDMSFTTTKDLTRQQYASIGNALQQLKNIDVTSVNNANYSIPISNYQYISSNNAKINELRRTASMYLNNTANTNNVIKLLENIIKDRDYIIRFNPDITNKEGVTVNGKILAENGETIIELNPSASNYVEFLVVHEITHDIATKEMKELILNYAKQDAKFEKSLESLKERYKTNDVSDEVVADVCGELFGNREFIQSVVEKKPNIFKKILNNIRKLAEKIKGTGANEYVNFVEKLKTMWEDAYYSDRSNLKDTKFSIQQDSNGNKYVEVDTNQDIFEGKSISEQVKIAKQYILNNFRENGINVNNENIKVTSKTANEYTHPKNQLPTTTKSSKMKASTELDNLLLISNYKYSKPDDGRHPFAKGGWDYYETTFKVGDNLFTGLVNVAKSENKKTLYDITNIKRIDQNRSTSANAFTTSLVNSVADNISQSNNNVKSNILPINNNMQNSEKYSIGNAGYVGHRKSVRAYGAEADNIFPASVADKMLGVSQGATKSVLQPSEWHHTGSFYNQTDYYDINLLLAVKNNDIETLNDYDIDDINTAKEQYQELKNWKKPTVTSNEYMADVTWLTWGGSRKYPIATEHTVKNTKVTEKGSFYYFKDSNGNDVKKKIGSNGTRVDRISTNEKFSQNFKDWNEYLKENFPSAGTKTKMSDIKLSIRDDIENSSKKNKILNPNEISKLTKEDANTTPILPIRKNTNKVNDGDSHFAKNIENKVGMLNEEQKASILSKKDVEFYDKVTNKESLDKAFKKINDGGSSETLRWVKQDSKNANATDVAEGWILLKQYADNGDYDSMVEIAKKMREIGTTAGQTVQAFNIMERMTPEGMVKYAQSELSEAYDKMVKNKSKEWIDKYREDFDLKPDEVKFIMDTMQEVQNMEDGYEKRVKLAEIQKLMTDKLPPEKGAKIKSWMRISMLFNPKTQVRNVAGNALIMPVNSFGDLFSSYADKLIAKKTGVRTTGNTNIKAMLKGIKRGAYEATNDYKKGINTKDMEGNRFEISDGKSFSEKNLMGKALNRTESLLNYVMDVGDRVFSEAAFENSLQNQLVLNNTTEITQEMIDIAHQEALSRTWNDNNNYTRFVLGVRKGLNKLNVNGYGLGDVLIPFAKTPANLTKAIVDYSPAGLVSTINKGINLKRSLANGQYTATMQHEFVQSLGKATAGTMLYILGIALAKAGITSGDSDDDKDTANFLKNTLGVNSYSIKIGGKSFTYDWAQPLAAPLSITANVVNSKNGDSKALLEGIIASLDSAGSILLEQSFLQSINDVLNDNDGVVSGIINEILELPARAVPTFSKQIADLVDGTQRTSFEYGKPIKSAINSIKAKIPFVSKTLNPAVDTMGREIQKYGGKNNIFNVFLNPANVSTENISESAEEIYRLYKETGETDVMPRVAPYYINQKGEKIMMTGKDRVEYQKASGKIIEDSIKKLLNNASYSNMSDSDKANVVKDIVNYSYNIAKKDVLGLELSNTYQKAYEYSEIGDIGDYYTFKESIDNTDKDTKKASITKFLIDSDLNNEQLAYLYGNYYSSDKVLNALVQSNISIKEYIKFNSETFESDYYANGKTVPNSRKNKVIKYINSLNLSIPQKAMLIKMEYSSFKQYDNQIVKYVNNIDCSSYDKKVILKTIGFTSYDKDIINAINSKNISVEEKNKELEELGFKVRNGRVYTK